MKLNLKGVHLDERDITLFSYLFAVKVASYEQIHRDIYSGISQDATGYRLRKIEDNGLIEIDRSRLILRGRRTVSLRKKGFDHFVKTGTEKRVEIASDAIIHDLILGDIRYKLRLSPKIVEYRTENEIQSWGNQERNLNSDALLTVLLASNTFQIPLEYERSQKEGSRYTRLVKHYYKESEYPLIFFVADCTRCILAVQNTEKELFKSDKPKFFYILKQDLLESDTIQLKNYHSAALNMLQ